MSSRFLKKVLREQEQKLQENEPQIHEDEEEEDGEEEKKKKLNSFSLINPFDLLDDDGHVSDQVRIHFLFQFEGFFFFNK